MRNVRGAALAVLTCVLFPNPSFAAAQKQSPVQAEHQAITLQTVPTQQKLIAFTFDDGPNLRYTPQVLDLLQKYHAHATFFVIGREVVRFPEMIKKIQAAGMEVGNHGMHHKWLHKLTPSAVQQEAVDGAAAIVAAGGKKPYLYRLPGGYTSDASAKVLGQLGYTVVGWSIDTHDWQMRASAKGIEHIVMRDAAPGRIVILHDGAIRREPTLTALSHVLPELEAQGYHIVSVGQLLRASDYQVLRKLAPQPCSAKKPKTPPRIAPERPRSWLQRLLPSTTK